MGSASTFALALPAILIFLVQLGLCHASDELPHPAASLSERRDGPSLAAESDDLRDRVSRLEAELEESFQKLDDKKMRLEERENLLKELSEKTYSLERALSVIEGDVSMVDSRLSTLEEEVRSLWAASRRNNFDIHVLKTQADEADERLRAAASKVEKLAEIVSEGWIQIKNFEQAQQFAEMRATNARWESASRRCLFLKFFYKFFGCHPPEVLRVSKNIFHSDHVSPSYKSEALQQLKRAYSAVKDYHFELQSIIRREMERNEVTAALNNEELVFFVASAIVVFPLLSAWIWISSLLR